MLLFILVKVIEFKKMFFKNRFVFLVKVFLLLLRYSLEINVGLGGILNFEISIFKLLLLFIFVKVIDLDVIFLKVVFIILVKFFILLLV